MCFLRELQELEYMESLRNDIEKEILSSELEDEKLCNLIKSIEKSLINDAIDEDYEQERTSFSPNTLRMKRLLFFEKNKENKFQCKGITKNGNKCKKIIKDGNFFCNIHFKNNNL